MKNSELIERVRQILDEVNLVATGATVEYEGDVVDIDARIKACIPPNIKIVTNNIDSSKMNATDLSAKIELIKNENGSGYCDLPGDFIRLVYFKLKMWKNPVYDECDSNTYKKQKYMATRGGIFKPICAVVQSPTEGVAKRLEYYSLPPSVYKHELESAKYIALPDTDNADGTLDAWSTDKSVLDLLAWLTARDVAITFTAADKVKLINIKVEELIKTL